ncbi:MAG: type II toxin-antitoxin system HicA family toxin [Anaerolineae bacterium]|nr:type II toxin-antitoxin system HicA family toxin [Anaerolineae bacterium]
MPKLRSLSGKQVVAILERLGFQVIRIKGSHHIMNRIAGGQTQRLNVPVHGNKPISPGTLRSIYRDARQYVAEEDLRPHFYTD